MAFDIQIILVPQGAEHRAVCAGLRRIRYPPTVFPVPIGGAIVPYLERLQQANFLYPGQQVLILGLCGGLTSNLSVGDAVLYEECLSLASDGEMQRLECDRHLTSKIRQSLASSLKRVTAITTDRVISTAREKHRLAHQSQANVVDTEGFAALRLLTDLGVAVAMLRVVSDDCQHNIPDLTPAFTVNGTLRPLHLAIAFLKQPIAAQRLIRGSIQGLSVLQNLTSELFKDLV